MASFVRKPRPSPLSPTAADATPSPGWARFRHSWYRSPARGCDVSPGGARSAPDRNRRTPRHPLATVDRMRGGAVTQASAGPAACLSAYLFGVGDPTTQLGSRGVWRASFSPDGPGTLRITWTGDDIDAEAWGPGREWMLQQVGAMTGRLDPGF